MRRESSRLKLNAPCLTPHGVRQGEAARAYEQAATLADRAAACAALDNPERVAFLAPAVERLYPLSRYQSPFTAYRTIMADSASLCSMLQTNQELSRYIPVQVTHGLGTTNRTS